MKNVLFGQETEYFLSVIGKDRKQLSKLEVIHLFFELAKKLPHLQGPHDYGLFLVGRYFYLDCGEHIESATFECTDPWELVNHKLASEAILAQLTEDVKKANSDIQELVLSKVNVDYSGSGTTWGEHESYQVHKQLRRYQEQLIPHLVSRVIYTGAGGWHSSSPGLGFMVSPRALFFEHEVSPESTRDRGIFHTKNETLVGSEYNYRRLHVICGESLYCHKASLLKAGVTALVVKLIDLGSCSWSGIRLNSPLEALASFSKDTQCRTGVKTVSGETITAVDIQRHYYAHVMDHISEMPDWAPEICKLWDETLDALASGPGDLTGVLDWPTKFQIFSRYIESCGYTWDEINAWNNFAREIQDTYGLKPGINSIRYVLQADAFRSERMKFYQTLKKHGLHATRLKTFLRLREELFEIDTRCGQIGGCGIFSALDRQGMLRHHVGGINCKSVEYARENPPKGSRATLRGKCIQRFSSVPTRYQCGWTHIVDFQTKKILNLEDPFEEKERWESCRAR
jgi:hypothetical protein